MTTRRAKVWGTVAMAVVVLGVGAFFLAKKSSPPQAADPSDASPAAFDASKYADMKPMQVDPGRFYDYQMGKGPLVEKLRDLISVPLVIAYQSEAVHVLLRDIEWGERKAVLVLRSSIYWSDGKPFEAQHVVDAFRRFVLLTGPVNAEIPQEMRPFRELKMHAEGTARVVIDGFTDKGKLVEFLASQYMRPYRGDLGKGDQDLDEAFLASLGPYRVGEVRVASVTLPGALTLPPNDVFYKGPKQNPYELDLVPLLAPQN